MPDLSNCKYVDGKLCCWDKDIERFVEISVNLIINPSFYKKVIAAFMSDREGNNNG